MGEDHAGGPDGTDANASRPGDTSAGTRRRRRVTQAAPEGSDPHPFDPPTAARAEGENDDRLRADRPPHWG